MMRRYPKLKADFPGISSTACQPLICPWFVRRLFTVLSAPLPQLLGFLRGLFSCCVRSCPTIGSCMSTTRLFSLVLAGLISGGFRS